MATDQVLQWINNDLTLSQSIGNFETDFSNGYLFGEILSSFGQVELTQFTKKKSKEAKVNNFYIVENALRKLKVKFDGKLIHQIMEEERGASLRLLYQIKLAMTRMNLPDEFSMSGLHKDKMHTILQNKKEATLEMSKSIPPPTVGGKDIRTNKQKLADSHTIRFDVAQKQLFDSALDSHQKEMLEIQRITQEQRNSNIHKLIENQTFMKDWMKEGKDNWRINQKKRAEAIAKVKYFEDREVNIYKKKLENELNQATSEQINGISDFEKNLQKLGIQQGISMEEAIKKQEEKKGIPPGQIQNFSYAATMNKIKETKKNSDFAGKERDRRRRKMIVDQQNAQTKLDKEAVEDALIKKLLQQTEDEQRDAFIEIRTAKCKNNDFISRQTVANNIAERRRVENEAAEAERVANMADVEAKRQRENEIRRIEVKKINHEKKMVKRGLNIEIASGLVDLILDLADETYDITSASQTNQIENPQWREFMNIFKSGKKVSLRNVQQAVTKNDDLNRDRLPIANDSLAHDIQKQYWRETFLLNFYEYLSGSGAFNIPQLDPDMWNRYENQYSLTSQTELDHELEDQMIPFMSSKLLENPELVQIIDSLYSQIQQQENVDKPQPCEQLLNPTIKVSLLGRAFSGRKTIAKQMQEMLGQDVSILHIDEIIKEAIEYITPKEVDESATQKVDPKAKGKGKAKDEPVVTDIFEGKNTVQYKAIAQQIKDQYFNGDQPPRKIDLAELVLDDALLNGLVIERLKLLTEGKQARGADQIKQGVAREREIIRQLEEIENAAQAAAADPKAKKQPTKGQPNPEALNAELNEIRQFQAQGWILIGYPCQLSQAKLLEEALTGYQSKLDQPKSEKVEIRESWRKMVIDNLENTDAASTQTATQSGFDSFIFIETPDSECQRRTEGINDESNDHISAQRIQQTNEAYDSKVQSLKLWCQQFGLLDQNGDCKVTLNQEVNAEDWTDKEQVQENAITALKKVMAFKQQQFDSLRENFKEQLEVDDTLQSKPDASQKDMSKNASQFDGGDASPQPKDKETSQKILETNLSANSLKGKDEPTLETASKKIAEKSSVDGQTIKSSKRNKNQQRYEITDQEKINNWEEFVNTYFRECIQRFNDLVKQRSRVFSLFGQTQTDFIDFICRESPYQKKVNEFCDNFNRFSEQYPDLRGKEETRSELLKRVTMLNESLWQIVLDRKNEAVEQQQSQTALMQAGWETREKAKLITIVSQLMELEFDRFRSVLQLISGWVINQEIDLTGLCKRLDERCVQTFENTSEGPRSPMLDQVVNYLHGALAQLMQDPVVKNMTREQLITLMNEKTNFHIRCNTLKSYALLLLVEINDNTEKISGAFDGWIIASVKKENNVASQVIKILEKEVQGDSSYLDNIKVQNSEVESSIQRIRLDEGLPHYLQKFVVPTDMESTRLKTESLALLFNQLKQNAHQDLLDSQTFISLIIANYQARLIPDRWRTVSFQSIINLISKFAEKPLGNVFSDGKSPFASSMGMDNERKEYINWKKVFLLFSLASSSLPSDEQLEQYGSDLAYYGQCLSKEDFINAEAWFDANESTNLASEQVKSVAVSASNSEEGDGQFDTSRLDQLKTLIWQTAKRSNEEGVRPQDLIRMIKEIKACGKGNEQTFAELIC